MWGSTHYSMFPYFGSQWVPEKHKTRNATRNTIKSLYLDKNIRNWDKTLQYLPIAFINTPFLPYMWGNTHYSMFPYFGSQKHTKPGTHPKQ